MGDELWYVKLANGDVHHVTLDQLDGAFQAGHIDETTMVLAAGASQWTTLGDLAGLDEEAPAPEQCAPEAYVVPAHAQTDTAAGYIPQRPLPASYAPTAYAPAHVAPSYVPQRAAPVPQSSYARSAYAAPAPVASPGVASYRAPMAAIPAHSALPAYPANSLRPMSIDLGELDADEPFRRGSRKGRFFVAVLGLAAIAGGVGFAVQHAHLGVSDDLSTVAAAAAMAAPPAAAPVVADPVVAAPPTPWQAVAAPAPATPATNAAPVEASPLNPQFTTRLNESTTKKLLAADKAREAKSKARHAGGGTAHSSPKYKSTTFTTGGNKFDPLNSSI
jgi:hypothetical protein